MLLITFTSNTYNELHNFTFRDDPKPDQNKPTKENLPPTKPCRFSHCPEIEDSVEQVCCIEEKSWQCAYNASGL